MPVSTKLPASSIDDIRRAITERQTTATALARDFYARIKKEDPEIGAFLTLCEERALAQAAHIDALAGAGEPLPPLAGVPIAIKDVMVTSGVRTTAASKILDNFIPPYDCTAVARLEAAGAVILGKLNCDEFAMGSSTENSAYHPVHNPRDKSRVPGGSSGGSAAAVAAEMAVAKTTGGKVTTPKKKSPGKRSVKKRGWRNKKLRDVALERELSTSGTIVQADVKTIKGGIETSIGSKKVVGQTVLHPKSKSKAGNKHIKHKTVK